MKTTCRLCGSLIITDDKEKHSKDAGFCSSACEDTFIGMRELEAKYAEGLR